MMTQEKLYNDVAAMLDVDTAQLDATLALSDQGLDSLRLVTLVEQWRAEGVDVDFFRLVELASLNEWAQELCC